MSEKIVVPVLGESITEATVAKWLKNAGDVVEADEPIVELETDKVNLEVPSPVKGILTEINSKDGSVVEVGALLGSVSESGSAESAKKEEIKKITNKDIQINIFEVKRPELEATLVADSIARQIEGRVSYKRATKMAIASTMRMGAEGIKVQISGRLNGAEMARSEWIREGRVPLQTLRADIDYASKEANTIYGILGIKVWLFRNEILTKR